MPQTAKRIHNWRQQYRPLVAAALTAFWNDPNAVTDYCRAIINRWHQQTLYRDKHHFQEYHGHIIKTLPHPALMADAYDIARKMLDIEARSLGFLSPELHRQAENIIHGEGAIWSASEE